MSKKTRIAARAWLCKRLQFKKFFVSCQVGESRFGKKLTGPQRYRGDVRENTVRRELHSSFCLILRIPDILRFKACDLDFILLDLPVDGLAVDIHHPRDLIEISFAFLEDAEKVFMLCIAKNFVEVLFVGEPGCCGSVERIAGCVPS